MVCKDQLPYETTEHEGFKVFVNYVCPFYKIPSADTVARRISDKYESLSSIKKKELASTKNIALTCDIWTDTQTNKSYLGVTAHYRRDGVQCMLVLAVKPLSERHTAENISNWLLEIVDYWNIKDEEVKIVVCDGAANMEKAVKDSFGENRQLTCVAHKINLVGSAHFNDDSVLSEAYKKVKAIVSFVKKSVLASDALREKTDYRLIQSVETRWNSEYYMFERFLDLLKEVIDVLISHPNAPAPLSSSEVTQIKEFVTLLKPLEQVTSILSGENMSQAARSYL